MIVAAAAQKMIRFSNGSLHDIDHFLKVWAMAKTIGELEGLDQHTQEILELTAMVHDIACPLCREKYGDTNGKHQETEGAPMVRDFLRDTGMTAAQIDRVAFLVGHHHTFTDVRGKDYQILLEADYIANASENGYERRSVENFIHKIMQTESGKALAKAVFRV